MNQREAAAQLRELFDTPEMIAAGWAPSGSIAPEVTFFHAGTHLWVRVTSSNYLAIANGSLDYPVARDLSDAVSVKAQLTDLAAAYGLPHLVGGCDV
jgi:hypothetical protein